MSLLALFARRTEGSAVTETASPATRQVVMRFLTGGGATVELYRHAWTERHYATDHRYDKTVEQTGFEWRCTGCEATGSENRLRLSHVGYQEAQPWKSRTDANDHASTCRAMPRPTA